MHLGCQKVYAKSNCCQPKCIEIVYSFLEKRKSNILKQVWYFARLIVLWLSPKVLALGKNQNKFCFFARLIVPLTP